MTIPNPIRSMKTVRNRTARDVFRILRRAVYIRSVRRRLVLFDIDGTLITDGGAARDAFAMALRAVFGYEGRLQRYDFSGRTDPQITRMILRDEGLSDSEVDVRLGALFRTY